jgi:N-methylhydantoinase A
VTDANLVLGRLDADLFLGGNVRLDEERTRRVMTEWLAAEPSAMTLEAFAGGVLSLAESAMEGAIRRISIERGYDPREFTLVAFGGAGPLHACGLARALKIPRVLVPVMPGALSALGILMADVVREYSRTVMVRIGDEFSADAWSALEAEFAGLERRGVAELAAEGLVGEPVRSADLRYAGQGYELNVGVASAEAMLESFHRAHERRYGYAARGRAVEIVNVRVRLTAKTEPVVLAEQEEQPGDGMQAFLKTRPIWFAGRWEESAVYQRERLTPGDRFAGPALVVEYSATTVLPPGCEARVDRFGNLIVEVGAVEVGTGEVGTGEVGQ